MDRVATKELYGVRYWIRPQLCYLKILLDMCEKGVEEEVKREQTQEQVKEQTGKYRTVRKKWPTDLE